MGNEAIEIGISFPFSCKQELVAQWHSRLSKETGGMGTEPSAWPWPLAGHGGEGLSCSGVGLLVNKNGAAGEQAVHLFHLRIAHRDQ